MAKGPDTKQKIELAVTIAGILLLIFLIPGIIDKTGNKPVDKAGSYNGSAPVVTESVVSEERRYKSEGDWGRDIFYPDVPFSGTGSSGLINLALNGIVWDSNSPYAIINSKVVKAGDKIDAVTMVIDITENKVVVEQAGTRHTLELTKF
ncbi:MAG TPA: hypothetical protein ENN16_00045 [Candidatus Omnitrophica bacterium]|nr:hypothetical protein [Candidatus Omnitrophota bacterium]